MSPVRLLKRKLRRQHEFHQYLVEWRKCENPVSTDETSPAVYQPGHCGSGWGTVAVRNSRHLAFRRPSPVESHRNSKQTETQHRKMLRYFTNAIIVNMFEATELQTLYNQVKLSLPYLLSKLICSAYHYFTDNNFNFGVL